MIKYINAIRKLSTKQERKEMNIIIIIIIAIQVF